MGTRRSEQRRKRTASDRRGQTTLDFAIGISVFLAVLLFIFLFLPGILSPFTASAQEETVTSNRVADQLTTSLLASPSDPYVLDRYCTVQFFDEAGPAQCKFDDEPVEQQVGIASSNENLNITVRGNISNDGNGDDRLCWAESDPPTGDYERGLVEETSTKCDNILTRGGDTPVNQPSVTAVRVASLDGTDVTIYVEVW